MGCETARVKLDKESLSSLLVSRLQSMPSGTTEYNDVFQDLYYLHVDSVRKICSGIKKSEAEDLTQDIWLRVFINLNSFKHDSSFSTWLYRVATNECLQYLRKMRSRPQFVVWEDEYGDHNSYLDTVPAPNNSVSIEDKQLVEKVLSALPDIHRDTIDCLINELTVQETASKLKITEAAAKSRRLYARKAAQKYRKELECQE